MPAALPAAVPAPSTTSLPDGGETLTSPPPALPAGLAAPLAQAHFGVTCADVEVLTAERDQNLLLRGDDGRAWVMKIANPGEAHAITDFQTAALCHLEQAAPDRPVPRSRRAVDGATRAVVTLPDGRRSLVRMLAWLDGRPLADAPRSPRQRQNLAACLAGLGRAFAGFSHPGQDHYLQWDISRLDRVAHLLPAIDDERIRAAVAGVLADFEARVRPALPGLRRQVIYNDLNLHNVLVDPADPDRIAGIIDFGDIIAAPLVNDLAVAASYQFGADGNRGHAAEFVAAYHARLPLMDEEIRLLPLLIEARLSLTLLITGYRAARHPENARYILRNNLSARAALLELRSRTPGDNLDWITAALEDRR